MKPRYTPLPASDGLARATGSKGALVIGDRAFDVRKKVVLDLGREWTQLTRLPMVFALWAARPGALRPEDVAELARAAQAGLGMRTELAQAFAREHGGDPERYRRYLTQRIRYGLGPYEISGLEAFLARAADAGVLPATTLRFADDVVRTRRARRQVSLDAALQKGADGVRLDADEAELLDEKAPLLELGLAADMRRRALHPEGVVTYIVSRNVNYTNVCTTACSFCAFYRPRGHGDAYVLDRPQMARKIEETISLGGIELLLQGGLHPDLGVEWYEDLFRWVKANYPSINLHALSPEEIWHIARTSQITLEETIDRLVASGLDSIPGGGAEVLDDEVRRRIAPLKCSTDEWITVMRTAHHKGLKSTATLMFGVGEEARHRVNHFLRLRELQDETRGFTAFICWTFQPEHTRLVPSDNSAHAYLRTNALARLVLDNVPNFQASWVTMGGGVAQASLHMGCNDFGSVMIEENVVSAAGTTFQMDSARGRAPHPRRGLHAGAAQHALPARRRRPPREAGRDGVGVRVVGAPFVLAGPGAPPVADGAVALDGDVLVSVGPARRARGALRRRRADRRRAASGARRTPTCTSSSRTSPGASRAAEASSPGSRHSSRRGCGVARSRKPWPAVPGRSSRPAWRRSGDVSNTLGSVRHLAREGIAGTVYHEVFGFSAARAADALRVAAEIRARADAPPPWISDRRRARTPCTRPTRRRWRACSRPAPPRCTWPRIPGSGSSAPPPPAPSQSWCCGSGWSPASSGRSPGPRWRRWRPISGRARSPSTPWTSTPTTSRRCGAPAPRWSSALAPTSGSGVDSRTCPASSTRAFRWRWEPTRSPPRRRSGPWASSPSFAGHSRESRHARLLALAWRGAAVGAPSVGRLAPGSAPGVIAAPLEGDRPADPVAWLLDVHGERPFTWLARHRPEARA